MTQFCMISLNDRGNLGARQIVAYAKRIGVETILVNFGEYRHDTYEFSETLENFHRSWYELKKVLQSLPPTHIGISYRSAMAPLGAALAHEIRIMVDYAAEPMFKQTKIIAGGIGATSDPEGAAKWADMVCVGEGDKLVGAMFAESDLKRSVRQTLLANLDDAPFPDYEASKTYTIVQGNVTYPDGRLDNDKGCYPLLTSRGCPRACIYCHNSIVHELYRDDPSPYCRQRSVGHVLKEIAWARARWNVSRISIYDDLFIANPQWALEFAHRLPDVFGGNFWFMAHPKYIREDVIEAMVKAGCEEICVGVQSGSQRILDLYRRGTTIDDILFAGRILSRFPVAVKIDIISANPMETDGDIAATMRLLRQLPCTKTARRHVDAMTLLESDSASWHPGLSRLTVFPGSVLAGMVTQGQCEALHGPRQDFIDGLYRAAFIERWAKLDLEAAFRAWPEFQKFRDSRPWPPSRGVISDEHWAPLSAWLDERAKA